MGMKTEETLNLKYTQIYDSSKTLIDILDNMQSNLDDTKKKIGKNEIIFTLNQ